MCIAGIEELMNRTLLVILATFLLGIAIFAPGNASILLAQHATPEPVAPVTILSEVLGRAAPVAVDNPELSLGRVTVMPGAVLPVHHHAGTQIGVVVQGELTYTVLTGEVALHRGDDPAAEAHVIRPGETVVVRTGDALVEAPGSIHQGSNAGNVPLVIYLSTLVPAGAPRSIIVDATAAP
jgi:quercetin dioxygenase-like cupin family protein